MSSRGSIVETMSRRVSNAMNTKMTSSQELSWLDPTKVDQPPDEMLEWLDPNMSGSQHTEYTSWMN